MKTSAKIDSPLTAKTPIAKILVQNPRAAEILARAGLGCLGCPWAQLETLEQGAKAHGWSKKKLTAILRQLNGNS